MLFNVARVIRLRRLAMMSMSRSALPIPTHTAAPLTIGMMEMMRVTTVNPCSIVGSKAWVVFLSILTHLVICLEALPMQVLTAAIVVKHQASVHLRDLLLWEASPLLVLVLVT
jgi:hypothetical protein